MKIAIPTSDGIRISSNIKAIKGFKVFEIIEGKVSDELYVPCHDGQNSLNVTDGNGNGAQKIEPIETSKLSCIEDCQIVIANGLGKRMFEELVKAHKEAFITEATHVRGAINHFIRQTLRNHPELA
jgi:predicted Fe-Mo cluster-binding NifX family protein